jgi:hypothetical protein
LSDYLERAGGLNEFGEPRWRLVLASSVVWKIAGGKVWDENLSVGERGGLLNPTAKPLRDESGTLVERRRYPHVEGWLLQAWKPASYYDREIWFAPQNCLPDGTPKLGPFPNLGDYESQFPPMLRLPSIGELGRLLNLYWRGMTKMNEGTPEGRAKEAANNYEYAERKREAKLRDEFAYELHDKTSYLRSYSLEAGRERVRRGAKIGVREHIGN